MEILLSKGYYARIDDDCPSQYRKWSATTIVRKNNTYIYGRGMVDGRHTYLHRWIMKAPPDMMVDHIDHNTLNNCRANLRLVTNSQNVANAKQLAKGKTGYRGVFITPNGRYRAQIRIDKILENIGTYLDPKDAAKAYDERAKEQWGEYARLNFPDG